MPQRVRSLDFTSDGECLITCGDSHVKFWTMPGGVGGFIAIGSDAPDASDGSAAGSVSGASRWASDGGTVGGRGDRGVGGGGGRGGGDGKPAAAGTLEGWPATIADELKGATFVDVASGKGGQAGGLDSVFCVTAEGVLCSFTRWGDGVIVLECPVFTYRLLGWLLLLAGGYCVVIRFGCRLYGPK